MLGNNTLVTIGIPFYNNERTLIAAINSVLLQTYTNWELLLINDGSTDRSLEIAQEYADKDPRIILINDSENKGLIFRLNQIIQLSKGSFIARMDSDDMMMPERIEKQIRVFQNNPKLDVVSTAIFTIDENDNPIGVRHTENIEIKGNTSLFSSSLITHPSIMVNKKWYLLNKYDVKFIRAEDFELWCRTFTYTNFYRITEPLLLYREGKVNIRNYVLSMKTVRLGLKKHAFGYLSFYLYFIEILKTYLKSYLYQVMGFFNLQHFLTERRNIKLSRLEKKSINDLINNLKSNHFYNES